MRGTLVPTAGVAVGRQPQRAFDELDSLPMRNPRTAGWALLAATAAACGGASPTAPAPPPATAGAAQYFYLSGADGYWGFRVGANGSLSPVANGPLSATWPVFSADGSKAAFLSPDRTIEVRLTRSDGTFADAVGRINALSVIRNLPGATGYTLQWDPTGAFLYLIGGEAVVGAFNSVNDRVGDEVIALRHQNGALTVVPGSPQPGWLVRRNAAFLQSGAMVVPFWGYRLSGKLVPGEVRVYQMSGGVFTSSGPYEEKNPVTEGGSAYDLGGGILIAGDSSYRIEGSTIQRLSRFSPPPIPTISAQGVTPLFGRYVMLEARIPPNTWLLATYEVADTGEFRPIQTVQAPGFFFVGGIMRQGRVVVLLPSDPRGPLGSTLVGAAGELSSVRASTLNQSLPAGQLHCRPDRDGVFLYCLSSVSGALMAARVDADGTLTEIAPALSAPGFVPGPGGVLIRRP